MRRMLGDNRAVGLLRRDKTEKVFTHLIVGVWLKLKGSVFGGGRAYIGGDYRLGLCALNRHSGKRRERSAKRKHNC